MGVMSDAYHARIEAGDLELDPAQAHVLPEFDRFAEALAARPEKKGIWRPLCQESRAWHWGCTFGAVSGAANPC